MSHIRHTTTGTPPAYRMACDWPGCTTEHTHHLTARSASDARYLARADGWRAPNSPKSRRATDRPVDLCPAHRDAVR